MESTTHWAGLALALAIGLAAALLVEVAAAAWRKRRRSVRQAALANLAKARELPAAEQAIAHAKLLRRLVRTLEGEAAARRHGEAWAAQLDRSFKTTFFSEGAGRHYVDGLYRGGASPDVAALDRALEMLFGRIGS
jgi:hypothetical protein